MTTIHLVMRYAHISMGMMSLLSGAASMVLPKGSQWHRRAGNVFFVSMLIMAATGTIISVLITPNMGNVMGGTMAFYLTATAWVTVIRKPGQIGRFEIAAAVGAVAIAVAGFSFGLDAANSAKGIKDGYPPTLYYIFASAALLAALLDFRMIRRGGFRGAPRTTRHLMRMCFAMFMATASFFLGQAKLFPASVRETGLLPVPVLLVIGALVYFLIRVRVWPWLRRVRAHRVGQLTVQG